MKEQLDRLYYERVRTAYQNTYGAEPVAAYLLCEEIEIKRIRKILSQKRANRAGGFNG